MLDYYYVIIFIIIFLKIMFWSFYFYVRSRRIQAIRTLQQQQLQNPRRIIIVASQHQLRPPSDHMPIIPNEELPTSNYPMSNPPSYDEAVADPYSKPPDYSQAIQGQITPAFPEPQRQTTPGGPQPLQGQMSPQGQTTPWFPEPPSASRVPMTADNLAFNEGHSREQPRM